MSTDPTVSSTMDSHTLTLTSTPSTFVYTRHFCPSPSHRQPLTFTLTPISGGDPDIYIGTDRTKRPNASDPTSFRWSGTNFGADIVSIAPNSIGYCTSCTYYVAVLGFSDVNFRLLARTGGAPPTPLTVSFAGSCHSL